MSSIDDEHSPRVDLGWTTVKPVLALSADRARLARSNPQFGGPEDWFERSSLGHANAEGVSFDFFVNWRSLEVDDQIWIKRVAVRSPGSGIETGSTADVRRALEPWGLELRTTHRFATDVGFDDRWVVIPDWWDWTAHRGRVLFADVGDDAAVSNVQPVDFERLCDEIHARTGEFFRPGKGLIYSTSRLEAALAQTSTPWPGDADLVVVDASSRDVLGVIEYKKHTLDSPLRPTFSDYYPGTDSRRWDRLALLANRLRAPLYCLYFSVRADEERTFLQRVAGSARSLRPEEALQINAPGSADANARAEYVAAVVDVLRGASV